MAKYVNVLDVPLMRVGTWDASTGKEPVTRADLDAMVEAFTSGELDAPPIKIGHTDPRYDNPDFDGDPVYGQIVNLRVLDEKGGILMGDYRNVPEELAESMDSAYPYRSVEIAKDVEILDADGKVVASFARVLVGLALLGASAPAVKGLDAPVQARLSAKSGPMIVSVFSTGQFSLQGGMTTNQLRGVIQSALRDEPAGGFGLAEMSDTWLEDFDDTLAWYYRDGQMWQATYAVDADGQVTLGTPVEVRERRVFEPVTNDTPNIPPSFSEKIDPDKERPAGVNNEPKESADMALNDKQLARSRKLLGLPETATEAEVLAALDAEDVVDPAAAEPAAAVAAPDGVVIPPAPATAPATRELVNASEATEPTASVTISAAQFAALTEGNAKTSARLAEIEKREDTKRRDDIVSSAFRAGQLHKDEVPAWREALDKNEDVTVSLLSKRVPVFPVTEIGHDTAPAAFSLTPATVSEKELAADDNLFGINTGNGAK